MEISVTFADRPTVKDNLTVVKKLGQGKFHVFQVYSSSHHANYALKLFPKTDYGAVQYKKEQIAARFNHLNVIYHVPVQCHSSKFYGLTTELANQGDFFDLVTGGALNSEVLVRTYFRQLIEGLEHIHSQGVAHLDLKLENLMLGSNRNLKIIDFDQAQVITDDRMTSGGTSGYRAPEVISGNCRDLQAADVFSVGIILYAFLAREFPYVEKEKENPNDMHCYTSIVVNNEAFWRAKAHARGNKNYFSKDFVELVNGMLRYEPAERFKIGEIMNSKWYKGPVLDSQSLKIEMDMAEAMNLE